MACIRCLQGLPEECESDEPPCKLENSKEEVQANKDSKMVAPVGSISPVGHTEDDSGDSKVQENADTNNNNLHPAVRRISTEHSTSLGVPKKRPVGRPRKPDDEVEDARSTFRKRGNVDDPIDKNAPCEWRGYFNCGGGLHPIVGCTDGWQQTAHHGPDKTISNNSPSNRHKICTLCHNRWHAANDGDYDPTIGHWSISTESIKEQITSLITGKRNDQELYRRVIIP